MVPSLENEPPTCVPAVPTLPHMSPKDKGLSPSCQPARLVQTPGRSLVVNTQGLPGDAVWRPGGFHGPQTNKSEDKEGTAPPGFEPLRRGLQGAEVTVEHSDTYMTHTVEEEAVMTDWAC